MTQIISEINYSGPSHYSG